jgi:hypothetical protein
MPQQPVQVVFEDGLMLLMDDRNQGYDCVDVCEASIEDATGQIDRWAEQYAFDVEAAKHELAAYLSKL